MGAETQTSKADGIRDGAKSCLKLKNQIEIIDGGSDRERQGQKFAVPRRMEIPSRERYR